MDELATRTLSLVVDVIGYKLARHDEGEVYARLAEAKIARLGGHDRLEAQLLQRLATIADARGDYKRASDLQERSVELWERVDPTDPMYIAALGNRGRASYRARRFEEARGHFQNALDRTEEVYGPEHPEVAKLLSNVAATHHSLGDYESARIALERVVEILSSALGANHPALGISVANLGNVHYRQGRFEEALAAALRSREIKLAELDPEHPKVGFTYHHEGMALIALKRFDEALVAFGRAAAIFEERVGPDSPQLIEPLLGTGEVYLRQHRPDAARPPLQQALKLARARNDPPVQLAPILYLLGRALWESDSGRDRERAMKLALEARAAYTSADDPDAGERRDLEDWLSSIGVQ